MTAEQQHVFVKSIAPAIAEFVRKELVTAVVPLHERLDALEQHMRALEAPQRPAGAGHEGDR